METILALDLGSKTGFAFYEEGIYFEEVVSNRCGRDAHAYGGFLATLTSWCENEDIPYQGVPVKTIKKFITGNGNANKVMVMDALEQRGYAVKDDNEADALALLLYVRAFAVRERRTKGLGGYNERIS